MQDGYKVIDMDTHVNPSLEVLEKYVDASFPASTCGAASRITVCGNGHGPMGRCRPRWAITVAPIPYDRFPGEAPREEHTQSQCPAHARP